MLRRIVLTVLVGLIAGWGGAGPGWATPGDEAELLVLGFSGDGRYFAFAQSGREPETWYPYASVHALDVTTDKWLPDSPISLVLKDREKTTRDARREVGETAEKRWGKLGLDTPGVTLLERKPGEPIDKGDEVEVTIPSIGPARLRLTPKLLPAEGCEGFAGESVGVVLDLLTFEGTRIRRLQEDSRIPSTRGCPIGYAIAEVVVLERKDRAPVIAVVFAVFKVGATGIDRRYLVATADLAKK
jgi:predicted secreted protein